VFIYAEENQIFRSYISFRIPPCMDMRGICNYFRVLNVDYVESQMDGPNYLIFVLYSVHHHHHHHLANMDWAHVPLSGPTRVAVCLTVSPGFFCLFMCSFFYYSRQSITKHSLYVLQTVSFVFLYFDHSRCYLYFLCIVHYST